MITVNVKESKKCAFCVHWYDPTNSAIKPKAPRINLWQLNEKASNYCEIKKYDKRAGSFCSDFSSKM